MDRKPARTGAERQQAYKARLAASGEPTVDAIAHAVLAVIVRASLDGQHRIDPAVVIERAAASVTADKRFSAEGFDNVLSRVAQPVSRQRRLA